LSTKQPAKIQFIEPMYALSVKNLPEAKDRLYEVKFDGYRCLAGKRNDSVTLWSGRGNLFTAQFPHIARACEQLPADTLLDGEIVVVDEAGGSRSICFSISRYNCQYLQAPAARIELKRRFDPNPRTATTGSHVMRFNYFQLLVFIGLHGRTRNAWTF
jgi:hypothetical protein